MTRDFVNELKWRGLLQDSMPGVDQHLKTGVRSGYIGFDPTADSLHVGNLVQIMILVHFQRCGHKPIALVGGATGMVGDPSGKSAERNLLDENTLRHNQYCIKRQLERFLDFNSGATSAEVVNNYDWFKEMSFLAFIRDVGKHITVNYMMAKDSVKNRLESGLSFTEFSYQLVQGYDFYWLWKHKGCTIQMGGSDQWGNITTGTELVRRKGGVEAHDRPAYAITTPLLTKSDGSKFGKSESGNIWLDAQKTSPYKFYQFWRNVTDEEASRMIRIFTPFEESEIRAMISEHQSDSSGAFLQRQLAHFTTKLVHGLEQAMLAEQVSRILFGVTEPNELSQLSDDVFLTLFEEIPSATVSMKRVEEGISLLELLSTEAGMLKSKAEAKRAIQEGSIWLNKQRIDGDCQLTKENLINGMFILLQRGKKNYFLVKVQTEVEILSEKFGV